MTGLVEIPVPRTARIEKGYIQTLNSAVLRTAYLLGWRWHRTGAEPDGYGSGTSLINREGCILIWNWNIPNTSGVVIGNNIFTYTCPEDEFAPMAPQLLLDHVIEANIHIENYATNSERTPPAHV